LNRDYLPDRGPRQAAISGRDSGGRLRGGHHLRTRAGRVAGSCRDAVRAAPRPRRRRAALVLPRLMQCRARRAVAFLSSPARGRARRWRVDLPASARLGGDPTATRRARGASADSADFLLRSRTHARMWPQHRATRRPRSAGAGTARVGRVGTALSLAGRLRRCSGAAFSRPLAAAHRIGSAGSLRRGAESRQPLRRLRRSLYRRCSPHPERLHAARRNSHLVTI